MRSIDEVHFEAASELENLIKYTRISKNIEKILTSVKDMTCFKLYALQLKYNKLRFKQSRTTKAIDIGLNRNLSDLIMTLLPILNSNFEFWAKVHIEEDFLNLFEKKFQFLPSLWRKPQSSLSTAIWLNKFLMKTTSPILIQRGFVRDTLIIFSQIFSWELRFSRIHEAWERKGIYKSFIA